MPGTLLINFDRLAHLPDLPTIHSKDVGTQVFTHRSFFARPSHIFEDPPGDPSPDNESLEHLGDTVLNMVVTILLNSMYPTLRVGPCTKIRALVVGNETLSGISTLYKLPSLLLLHPAQRLTLQASPHIQADLFEAYVGGLFRDQGLAVVQRWLTELLRPYAEAAYTQVRIQHGLAPHPTPPPSLPEMEDDHDSLPIQENPPLIVSPCDPAPLIPAPQPANPMPFNDVLPQIGHLSLFNQSLQQCGKYAEWRFSKMAGDGTEITPIWNVDAIVDGQSIGAGIGLTKKSAKNMAAQQGLIKLGIHVDGL